jgi:hypothetical protein
MYVGNTRRGAMLFIYADCAKISLAWRNARDVD